MTTPLHPCQVRDVETDERVCAHPARLYVVNGCRRWICDLHAPMFEPEAVRC